MKFFFQAYEYTQYAWKGDAKKEVNGFSKSILLKLIDKKFSQSMRWDRASKKTGEKVLPEENGR
jgi:hypothetical protein